MAAEDSEIKFSDQKGLEMVWMMLSEGQLCIDVPTLVSACPKMGADLKEDAVRSKMKELDINEGAIDFDAFVKFFATYKKDGGGIPSFDQIAVRYASLSAFVAKFMDIKPVNVPMLMRYSALLLRAEWKGRDRRR